MFIKRCVVRENVALTEDALRSEWIPRSIVSLLTNVQVAILKINDQSVVLCFVTTVSRSHSLQGGHGPKLLAPSPGRSSTVERRDDLIVVIVTVCRNDTKIEYKQHVLLSQLHFRHHCSMLRH